LPWLRVSALVAVAALAAVIGKGALSGNSGKKDAEPHPIAALGSGFFDPAKPPPPEGTIRPRPGSWDAVHPPRGYRVVLLTAGDDPATTTLVTEVKHWAKAEQVALETVTTTGAKAVDGIVQAMDSRPDLVLCAGHVLVDALALVTASHLEQQFLIVGAQLPEPTVNVTAAIWRGASTRGKEVPDTDLSFNPSAFTSNQAGAAIRAGVASVLNHLTGIVISLD